VTDPGRPLRVLCLSNMWPGPADPDYGAFVRDMCDALAARGMEVEAAVIDSRAAGPRRTPSKYARLLTEGLRAARWADVVYAHYLFPTGAVAATIRRRAGLPYVVTAHGGDVRNLDRRAVRRGTQAALAGAAAVIAVSGYLADELRASGMRLPPVHVANMGVDLRRFRIASLAEARAALGLPADGPLLLGVGGLTQRKDPLTLLQAFARVRARHPGARLALVGDGPLAAAVRAGAARLDLAGAVVMPGALPHEAVPAWFAACDLLSVVSRVEPLGQVALEALASGRPVVATAVGGTPEVVPPAAGAVVRPGDPPAAAEAMLRLLADPPSPEACRHAAEAHALDRQAARVAAILAGAAGRPETGAP
jgi:glycosyltransferase involved in cell wall biosynthesis